LWRDAKFLIIVPYVCKIKSPLASQNFHLLHLNAEYKNSKCAIKFQIRIIVIISVNTYRAIEVYWIDCFSLLHDSGSQKANN